MYQYKITLIIFSISIFFSWSQEQNDTIPVYSLNEVVLTPEVNWLNKIAQESFKNRQVISAQDVLQTVPGLWIGQHAGGGKAEQLFLRGFDLDHGTDIAINVDGVPVNMVSHAHGQGYADLHYVIPETVEIIDFEKGPYSFHSINFATAGAVDFQSKNSFDQHLVKFEIGSFNTHRVLSIWDLSSNQAESWFAFEALERDGPFESPQNFQRINAMASWNRTYEQATLKLTANHFTSSWDASGQLPMRAIRQGIITRFGAIDDKEGGTTSRSQFNFKWDQFVNKNTTWTSQVYGIKNKFSLFSNFTFFLEDPINGDQIHQAENRTTWGITQEVTIKKQLDDWILKHEHGIQVRADLIDDLLLAHTLNRTKVLQNIQFGTVNERQWGTFHHYEFTNKNWDINVSLRWDEFQHTYRDQNNTYELNSINLNTWSPKLKVSYLLSDTLTGFFNIGKGFHSNDTRALLSNELNSLLPSAYGIDVGFNGTLASIDWHLALWQLQMNQEFVYVGDAGVVEAKGASIRRGVDISLQQQISSNLQWNFSFNTTDPRFKNEAKGANYIPLAPRLTSVFNVNWNNKQGFFSQLEVRHIADRPANEDNSIVASGYSIVNSNFGIKNKKSSYGIQLFNLLNSEWNETQFATESRLLNEVNAVEEIHFTPGSPLDIRLFYTYSF